MESFLDAAAQRRSVKEGFGVMVQGHRNMRQADYTRVLRGVAAAGVEVERIEIDPRTGKIIISTSRTSTAVVNDYDAWKRQGNAR
jgi:hypothetical protein